MPCGRDMPPWRPAEAQGDDLIGEVVRAGLMTIRETVHLSRGADADGTASFFACRRLGNTLTAIGLPASTGR
ncbi:hypothetical protein GCM10023084_73900 [Streptomyces lacrimifluminis]|uniref:Uncharacterized protein n=1 Tax=Streptomyces lacrimifluminis TaxID=1500077 RepID=A0A917P6W3_9ACTN|nr:hypothetical protein GCM10012282_72180 [Streptomyces lacrimifluminis]